MLFKIFSTLLIFSIKVSLRGYYYRCSGNLWSIVYYYKRMDSNSKSET